MSQSTISRTADTAVRCLPCSLLRGWNRKDQDGERSRRVAHKKRPVPSTLPFSGHRRWRSQGIQVIHVFRSFSAPAAADDPPMVTMCQSIPQRNSEEFASGAPADRTARAGRSAAVPIACRLHSEGLVNSAGGTAAVPTEFFSTPPSSNSGGRGRPYSPFDLIWCAGLIWLSLIDRAFMLRQSGKLSIPSLAPC
jgi:hypothetical protein